jgi:predicted helicase
MQHMLEENIGIIMPKRVETKIPWQHVFVSNMMVEHVAVSLKTIDYFFPLYIYPALGKKDLFSHLKDSLHKETNIDPKLFAFLFKAYKKEITSEDFFHYVYSVLYSNILRSKYKAFLRNDFPRVAFTKDYKLFSKLAELGEKLVDLHLLKSKELEQPVARFQGKGNGKVEKPKYEKSRVYINAIQYFDGVKPEVWEYQIGGYQVCDKWLKDRKGRTLSLEDIKHYCKIVTSLEKTIAIQKDIDKLYPKVEENLLELNAVSKKE